MTVDAAIDSYRLSVRAGNKSPATTKTYLAALAQFSRFLAERGMPRTLRAIRREHVETFIVSLQDVGQRPATVSVAHHSLQPFFEWALGEDEIAASPIEACDRRSCPRSRRRHTYAHMWLSDGGNEGDLMRLAGWKTRSRPRDPLTSRWTILFSQHSMATS